MSSKGLKYLSLFMIGFCATFGAIDFYTGHYFFGLIQVACLFLNLRNYRSLTKAETETYERHSLFK